MKARTLAVVAALALPVAMCGGVQEALAQTPPAPGSPGIKRTPLQRFDLDATREVIVGIAEIAPGAAAGRHTHAGVETGYLIEGEALMEIDGEPPRRMKAGDSYTIPAGRIHDAKALGDKPAKVIATYIVEKGKPLATPQ